MSYTLIAADTFTSTGAGVKVPLPGSADYFVTKNVTKLAAAAPTGCIEGEWFGERFGAGKSADNDGIRWRKNGSAAVLVDSFSTATASDGFTYVKTIPFVEAENSNAITDIDQADGATVTQTNTYNENDILRIYNTTAMLQIAGMPFQISSVSSSDYVLLGLDSSGFAAAATAGNTRRISRASMDPEHLFITDISQATQAVVKVSIDPSVTYVAGMKLHFSIPQAFGMVEMDGLTATILSVNTAAYEMTIDVDTSAFTAFAFPTSANAASSQRFAMAGPAGASTQFNPVSITETGYDFLNQPFRTSQFTPYMYLGGGASSPAGANNDVINWFAYRLENLQ